MPKAHSPRHGSMGVWPRVRSKRSYTRVRSWPDLKDTGMLGFAGYKVGMTHVILTDNRKNSHTKGEELSWPVTIVECPPLRILGVRFYKKGLWGLTVATEIVTKGDKYTLRKLNVPKKEVQVKFDSLKFSDYKDIRVLVSTQPNRLGIGKKKPEVFEIGLGGSVEEKFNWSKDNLGKEISVKDVLKEGSQIDIRAITTGKGFQGPVKRFGVKIRARKAEKTKRGPGSLGGWKGHAHFMYRIAHAGQMGYHQRVDFNKYLLKIGDNPEDVNVKGGFIRYGNVKNDYILLKGSVLGPKKRMLRLNIAARPNKKFKQAVPDITLISKESQQGN